MSVGIWRAIMENIARLVFRCRLYLSIKVLFFPLLKKFRFFLRKISLHLKTCLGQIESCPVVHFLCSFYYYRSRPNHSTDRFFIYGLINLLGPVTDCEIIRSLYLIYRMHQFSVSPAIPDQEKYNNILKSFI